MREEEKNPWLGLSPTMSPGHFPSIYFKTVFLKGPSHHIRFTVKLHQWVGLEDMRRWD
jgi:hypothetical protein